MKLLLSLGLALTTFSSLAYGQVVINEILYHAPMDLRLEYVELHNPGDAAVDLEGWSFSAGIEYTFPEGVAIAAGGYVVLARGGELFGEFYDGEPAGIFEGSLANGGERLALANPAGEVVDSLRFNDRAPWPLSADGYSASLERVCPGSPADNPANWVPSPLSNDDRSKPAGTPGARNHGYCATLPPVVKELAVDSHVVRAGEPSKVQARVEPGDGPLDTVELLYRVAEPGNEGEEVAVPMQEDADSHFTATIPGQAAKRLVRFRVRATDRAGAVRLTPHPCDTRPAESIWVMGDVATAKIPVVQFVNVGSEEFQRAKEALDAPQGRRGGGFFPFRGRGADGPGFPRRGPGGRRFDRRGPGGPGFGPFGSGQSTPLPAQGRSAFLYTDPRTKKTQIFDFVHIAPRPSGYKVRLNKDRPLEGVTTLNILYEPDERSILTEALAYELYGLAGSPTLRAGYVRVLIDGALVGYHLVFEQPNGAFFRRHKMAGGNLYKVIWQGSNRASRFTPASKRPTRPDIVGRYEKKTAPHDGYDDLITLVEMLEKTTEPDELWEVIQQSFDIEQVINYFAVNTLLSHWDGFFNNYFLYHDVRKSGKWMMLPWDQDSTWGHRMSRGNEVFAEMPLTFGMEGDVPPGGNRGRDDGGPRRGFGFGGFGGRGGAMWWRPGGEISRPLLANPEFRRRFLARLEVLAKTVYTEEVFGPKFEALRDELEEEVRLRAKASGRPEEEALRELEESLTFLGEHLVKRREYLLENIPKDPAARKAQDH